jgi:hypothetical protein
VHTVAHADQQAQFGGLFGTFLAHVDVGDVGLGGADCRGHLGQHALAVAEQHD